MSKEDTTLEELVQTATRRAYERAVVYSGEEPSSMEVAVILLQSQISMLASALLDEDELIEYWKNVLLVVQGGRANGLA